MLELLKTQIVLYLSGITYSFYCTTIAYHVELNTNLGGRRHTTNVQENRRLVFAVALGCTLVELISTCPPFLVGRVTWKCFILLSYFILFFSLYLLLDVPTWLFCVTNVIEYSVKLPF